MFCLKNNDPRQRVGGLSRRGPVRRGLTLIELVVVIAILVLLAAVAVPLIKPALQDAKIRETSRQVHTLLVAQQTRAATTGRPAGVLFERQQGSDACLLLYPAEVPPPYSGDIIGAQMQVGTPGNNLATFDAQSGLLTTIVRPGDLVRFDYKGPWYTITAVNPAPANTIAFQNLANEPLPATASYRYQIQRQPQRRNTGVLELPTSACIDLSVSGRSISEDPASRLPTDPPQVPPAPWPPLDDPFFAQRTGNVSGQTDWTMIMFEPNGQISEVWGRNSIPRQPVLTSVYLMIGRTDQISSGSVLGGNLADERNYWVRLNSGTGKITVAPNVGLNPAPPPPPAPVWTVGEHIQYARQEAVSGQSEGGR